MGKKLAIKGHVSRGKEVIETLEMMGGNNIYNLYGDNSYSYYVIEGWQKEIRAGEYIFGDEDMCFFTLEEFLEEYPFKTGDKVMDGYGDTLTIKSMSWCADCETMVYDFEDSVIVLAAEDLLKWNMVATNKETDETKLEDNKCERTHEDAIFDSIIWHLRNSVNNGKQNLSGGECEDYFREVVKKNNENKMKNVLAELLEHIKTTPKEDLEREFEEIAEWSNVGPTVEEFRTFCECVNYINDAGIRIENMNMNIEFDLTKYSYEVKNGKLVVSEKKPVYPKTYEECAKIMNCPIDGPSGWLFNFDANIKDTYYRKMDILMGKFIRLRICRDAYWKTYGEGMGLGKPWKPDWNDSTPKYTIIVIGDELVKHYTFAQNFILAFPTEEMRDAFYENFKDLIKQCKELL